eukprot:COSAG01_NODE_9465_length_2437_cov_17.224027_2_plen_207_part_00
MGADSSSVAGDVSDSDSVTPNPPRSTPDAAHINLLAPVASASSPKLDQQAAPAPAPAPAPTGGGLAAPAAAIQGNALFQRMRAQAEAAQMAAEEAEQAEGQRRREAAEWEEVSGERQPPRLEHVDPRGSRGVCRAGADGNHRIATLLLLLSKRRGFSGVSDHEPSCWADAEGNLYYHHLPTAATSWDPPPCWVGHYDHGGRFVRDR